MDGCCRDDEGPNEKGLGSDFGRVPNVKDGGAAVPVFNWTVANGLLEDDGGGGASLATSFVEAKALAAAGFFAGGADEDGAANFLQSIK